MSGVQKCSKCDEPSLPGLARGHGMCQFHWDEAIWGTKWAKACKQTFEKEGEKDER
jgi:hypothetical protein